MSFNTSGPVYCPNCPPQYRKRRPDERVGVHLELTVENYSGCGVDFADCPECGKRFQVSYKVDEVIEI